MKRALVQRREATSSSDSNIHSRLKGIAAADANARRPRKMFGAESRVERYRDIDPIQPMIVTMEKANSRFTRARGSRATTTRPRLKRTAHRMKVPTDCRSGLIYLAAAGFPITSAETLPPKLWPLTSTLRIRAARARFGT